MAINYVVTLAFPRGAPSPEQREAQQEFLARLRDDGTLVYAGRFTDERGGGMAVLEAPSLDEARRRYAESPLVADDVVDWDVREWDVTWTRDR
jgi:uncharacterized protein YciI